MAEPLEELIDRWCRTLSGMAEEREAAFDALAETLRDAGGIEPFDAARATLRRLVEDTTRVAGLADSLSERADAMARDWRRAWQYTPAGIDALREQLASGQGTRASGRWLDAVLTAIDAGELAGADAIAQLEVETLEDLGAARAAARALFDGAVFDAFEVLRELARDARLSRQQHVVAARIAAWLAVTRLDDAAAGRELLDAALELAGGDGRTYAERAALHLRGDQTEAAAADAQRARDLAPSEPLAHFLLGRCAESNGDAEEADELYRSATGLMTVYDMTRLGSGATLFVPSGRAQLAVAWRLLELGERRSALTLGEQALSCGVTGATRYPEIDVYALLREAHHRLGDDAAASRDALEVGRRWLWSGDSERGIEALIDATRLDGANEEAHWLLSDAFTDGAWRAGEEAPDERKVADALRVWEGAQARFGPPAGEFAWAYLTRALIEHQLAYREHADLETAQWRAVGFIERALVHRPDGYALSLEARFLRDLNLVELSWAANEQARELGVKSSDNDGERVALLAFRGRFDEADELAVTLQSEVPDWAWLNGARALIAFRQGRYRDALELLRLPLSQDYDVEWYRALAALCHMALGERAEALEQYADLVRRGRGIAGYAKSALAMAHAILGDAAESRRWLKLADADRTLTRDDVLLPTAILALSEGRVDDAIILARDAVRSARMVTTAAGTREQLWLSASALPEGTITEAQRADLKRALDDAVEYVGAHQDEGASTADAELEARLAGEALESPPAMALVAIRARRHADAGELSEACDDYALLQHVFEPEAALALRRLLRRRRDDAAERGELDEVENLQRQLLAAGEKNTLDEAGARAEALLAAGQGSEAVEALVEIGPRVTDDSQALELHERTGMVAVRAGNLETAEAHIRQAVQLARQSGDAAREGQLLTWLGAVHAAVRDAVLSERDLVEALDAWRRAGVYEPSWTLATELTSLVDTGLHDDLADTARETLEQVLEWLVDRHGVDPAAVSAVKEGRRSGSV